jgi:hypothetical protein
MLRIPTLSFRTETDYVYNRAWHTLYDTYNELVPYIEHQQHSALVTAVVAYGMANLDKPLTRAGVYLPDGLYADIVFGSGDSQKRIMDNPRLRERAAADGQLRANCGGQGRDPAASPARNAGREGQRSPKSSGDWADSCLSVAGGTANAIVVSDAQKSVAIPRLPRTATALNQARCGRDPGSLGTEHVLPESRANPGLRQQAYRDRQGHRRPALLPS